METCCTSMTSRSSAYVDYSHQVIQAPGTNPGPGNHPLPVRAVPSSGDWNTPTRPAGVTLPACLFPHLTAGYCSPPEPWTWRRRLAGCCGCGSRGNGRGGERLRSLSRSLNVDGCRAAAGGWSAVTFGVLSEDVGGTNESKAEKANGLWRDERDDGTGERSRVQHE